MIKKIKKIYEKNEEIINYVIVGILTTLISLISYYLCVYTILNPNHLIELQIANIFSWICAVVFAYFSNRKYVFKSSSKKYLQESTKFILSRIGTLLIDMFLMFLMVTILKFNDKIIKLAVMVIVTILNYVFSKIFVFMKDGK